MSVKDIARKQRISRINKTAANPMRLSQTPKEGWIAFVRHALGMSGAQLGKRLSLSRGRISQAEKAEPDGGVTLRTMEEMAAGMGCRFVYAIIPADGDLEDVIERQARKKATAIVKRASTHMALENQSLRADKIQSEIERLTQELMREQPSNFWEEE
nr:mobile mystery protein A [uncultured Hyphomonas sp.]